MRQIKGIGASHGIAIAPAFVYRPTDLVVHRRRAEDPAHEWSRFRAAAQAAEADLESLRRQAAAAVGETEAAIFEAHRMIIRDPDLEQDLRADIDGGASAEAAVESVLKRSVDEFAALDDPLFRERAMDFADVRLRLLRLLLGVEEDSLAALSAPAIVVAADLLPSDTARMNRSMVRGFCTARGGALSHTAILARNLGLPAVVGAGEALMQIEPGTALIVDGDAGLVIAEADESQQAAYRRAAESIALRRAEAQSHAHEPAVTREGQRVEVAANIGLPGEEQDALAAGAEGIGLLRTEFLFTGRTTAPDEDEQYNAYRPIFEAMDMRPVIARTLDIGGDKPAPFLSLPHEDNPFLGWRAIRIGLAQPDLLKAQLRALLRAGHGHNLKIMFPMVATVEEMQAARRIVDECRTELKTRGTPYNDAAEIGTMIEIPSAALIADRLAAQADFFSIGSNDLTQYTLAADRGNPAVAHLSDPMHPAVLRLVDMVIRGAHAAGIPAGMCGEMAGDPAAIPVLLGLGLDEFSMGAASVPGAKALIREWSLEQARTLAQEALKQPGAEAVRALVKGWGDKRVSPRRPSRSSRLRGDN